jgi:hypothetical protein
MFGSLEDETGINSITRPLRSDGLSAVRLKKFHWRGYGKILLKTITTDYLKKDIYLTSSNIAAQKIVGKLNFEETRGLFDLPLTVKLFLLKQIYEHIHWEMITEFIRKKLTMKSSARKYYIKYA